MPEKPVTEALRAAVKLNLALMVRCIGYAVAGAALLGAARLLVGIPATIAEIGGGGMIGAALVFQLIDLYRVFRGGK